MVFFSACSRKEPVTTKEYELTLKKSLDLRIKDFVIQEDRLVLNKSCKISPLGEEEVLLKIGFGGDDLIILVWKRRIKMTQANYKSDYYFQNCDEIWLNRRKISHSDLNQLTDQATSIESILVNRDYAVIEYHFDLPTFCSKELLKNPKSALRRTFAQKKFEVDTTLDIVFHYPYIQLNHIVYKDFQQKGIILPNDTVYLVNKVSVVTERLTLSDEKVVRFLHDWN